MSKNHPFARAALDRWHELKNERARHEQDWEDIARLIRPQRGGFSMDDQTRRRMEKPLSSEPILAQSSFAAGIYASVTNPANRWAGFETPDQDFNNWKPMADWLDIVDRKVMTSFGPSMSSFYSQTFQGYSDISAFGQFAAYDEIDVGRRRFKDVTISIADVVVDIDADGHVNELVRRMRLTPRAAVREFGDKQLPPAVLTLAEKNDPGKITFYRHILPNDQFTRGMMGPRGKRILSVTVCEADCWLIKVGGYEEMPAYYPRWDVDSGHTYGTGPGFIALASARSHQQMDGATIRAAQFAADPTMLAPDRNVMPLNGIVRPGQTVYGAISVRGERLLQRMEANGSIGITIEEKRAKLEEIKNAFHYAIMSLQGRTGITTEESQIMEEARLRNWAPHADRIMEEYGAPKAERRMKLLWRAGQLPPPPKEAQGMPLQLRYTSQATMALRAREGLAIRRFIGDLGPLAQLDPRYADRVDPDGLVEALHDASPSLPARILRSREQADEIAKARAQQTQQAQMMDMAQQGGGVLKDLAAAGAAGQGGGGA